jgi:hypothetical protein
VFVRSAPDPTIGGLRDDQERSDHQIEEVMTAHILGRMDAGLGEEYLKPGPAFAEEQGDGDQRRHQSRYRQCPHGRTIAMLLERDENFAPQPRDDRHGEPALRIHLFKKDHLQKFLLVSRESGEPVLDFHGFLLSLH